MRLISIQHAIEFAPLQVSSVCAIATMHKKMNSGSGNFHSDSQANTAAEHLNRVASDAHIRDCVA
jgi:hypothetical protein